MQRQLPILHGIAILAVILNHAISLSIYMGHHFGAPTPTGLEYLAMMFLKTFGFIAVPVFLFSSGSFFVYSAHGKDLKTAYRTVWAGLKRLVWPYIIWSALFYILLYILEGTHYSVLGYLKNLIVGYPYNFVPLLLVLYALAPIFVYFARRFPWQMLIMVGIYQLYLLNAVFPGSLGFVMPQWALFLSPPIIRLPFATWGLFFPLGIVFTLYSNAVLPYVRRLVKILIPAAIVFFICIFLNEAEIIRFPLSMILFPFAAVPLLMLLKRESLPQVQQLERVGKRSYGIYLMNMVIINLVLLALHALTPWLYDYQLLLGLIAFVLGVAVITLWFDFVGRRRVARFYQVVFG